MNPYAPIPVPRSLSVYPNQDSIRLVQRLVEKVALLEMARYRTFARAIGILKFRAKSLNPHVKFREGYENPYWLLQQEVERLRTD